MLCRRKKGKGTAVTRFLECGIAVRRCAVGWGGGVAMECALIYFPSPRLTPSSPGQPEMQPMLSEGRATPEQTRNPGSAGMKAVLKCL